MAGRVGRQVTFEWGDTPVTIPGVREKGIELNGEPIDITSDEDAGVRQLLSDVSAQREVSISISGVTKDRTLSDDWFAGTVNQDVTITYPLEGAESTNRTITGKFFLSSYSESEPYNDATTFDATLLSSGTVTLTAAS